MKVKQTVAAVCLAAIMATSVCASAGSGSAPLFGYWQTRSPLHNEVTKEKWEHGLKDNRRTVYSYFQSPWSEKSAAMVYFNEAGCCIDWKYNARAKAIGKSDKKISYHEEFWAPALPTY